MVSDIPNNFPAIIKYLEQFKGEKKLGDNSTTKVFKRPWWSWMQEPVNYWDDLNSQKIIWGEISDKTKFCIDLDGKFLNEATTFLMTGNSLLYLLGILNSKLSEYLFSKIGTTTGVGTVRWKKFTIEQLPVPFFKVEDRKVIEQMVRRIVENSDNFNFKDIENEINHKIYELLDFTIDEINFIESQYNQ